METETKIKKFLQNYKHNGETSFSHFIFKFGAGYCDGIGDAIGNGFGDDDVYNTTDSFYGFSVVDKFESRNGYKHGNGGGRCGGIGNTLGDGFGDGKVFKVSNGFYNHGKYISCFGDSAGNGYGGGKIRHDFIIKRFKGSKVYYVDNLPCIFKSVHENYASVENNR